MEPEILERGLTLYAKLIDQDRELREALEASRAQFFRGASEEDSLALRRHLEWFLFERGGSAQLVAERLLGAWRAEAEPELVESSDAYLSSHAGLFRVESVDPGNGASLQDLAGLGNYQVEEPGASQHLESGDLIVGRLYGSNVGGYRISPAAQLLRNSELGRAIEKDLIRMREEREHPRLRISQIELEAMFFGAGEPSAAPEDPVGEVRGFLLGEGVPAQHIDEILDALAEVPFDREALVHGGQDLLGEVLDQLAFESAVDLGRARALLLAAWERLSASEEHGSDEVVQPEPAPTNGHADRQGSDPDAVRAALTKFAEARQGGAELEGCFDALERDLGLPNNSGDEDSTPEMPDFPGVVTAVVEEFRWQVGLEEDEVLASDCDILNGLGEHASSVGVIENLGADELLTYAVLWLPERHTFVDPEQAERAVRILRRFVEWLEAEHSVQVGEHTDEILAELERDLPRVALANQTLVSAAPAKSAGKQAASWLEIEGCEAPGKLSVRGPGGLETVLEVEPSLSTQLRPGDFLRFELDAKGRARPVRAFPPQAAPWVSLKSASDA